MSKSGVFTFRTQPNSRRPALQVDFNLSLLVRVISATDDVLCLSLTYVAAFTSYVYAGKFCVIALDLDAHFFLCC